MSVSYAPSVVPPCLRSDGLLATALTLETQEAGKRDDGSFDKDFVKVDGDGLIDLILAANYLDIKSLLDLSCKAVADIIKSTPFCACASRWAHARSRSVSRRLPEILGHQERLHPRGGRSTEEGHRMGGGEVRVRCGCLFPPRLSVYPMYSISCLWCIPCTHSRMPSRNVERCYVSSLLLLSPRIPDCIRAHYTPARPVQETLAG